jgi:hypothetical protein
MPVITERFQTLPIYDKGTKSFAWIHQPKVTIFLKLHGQLYPYTIEAFVDSGATRNLFPADVLTYLQIPVDNGQKKFIMVLAGLMLPPIRIMPISLLAVIRSDLLHNSFNAEHYKKVRKPERFPLVKHKMLDLPPLAEGRA